MIKLIKKLLLNNAFLRFLASKYNKKFFVARKLKWLDSAENRSKLRQGEKCIIYSPDYGLGAQSVERQTPDICVYTLRNVHGSVNSSSFFDGNQIFVEKFFGIDQSEANYSSGHLYFHDLKKCLVRKFETKEITRPVLFLGGNGSFNYFHWLIEILPKLLFLDQTLIKTLGVEAIVVSDKVLEIDSFRCGLDLLNKPLGLPVIIAKADEDLFFSKVAYITTFNHTLYNSTSKNAKIYHNYFLVESLKRLRELVFSSHEFKNIDKSKKYPARIFLLRGKVSAFNRRVYNEDEVYSYFGAKGFIGIKIEDYTFFEQAYLFANAQEIVGPSGAFWANAIFCNHDTKALSWLPENLKEFSAYSTLSKYFGVYKKFLMIEPTDSDIHGPYIVDITAVASVYSSNAHNS